MDNNGRGVSDAGDVSIAGGGLAVIDYGTMSAMCTYCVGSTEGQKIGNIVGTGVYMTTWAR